MDKNGKYVLKHKDWRKIAKKERRRCVRRQKAQERDAEDERLRAMLEKSADYLNWIREQEKLAEDRAKRELEEHDESEQKWLEAEVQAQKEWQELQIRRAKARQEQLKQDEIIRKEFEAKQEELRKKHEELKRKQEEELRRQENIQREIDDYIDNGAQKPEALRVTTDSQPGKEICPFFSKTAACRYGDTCSRNHRRSALTKIIVIPGFYNHFSLEKNTAEYDTDIALEYEAAETRKHYREFYNDVVPELESFGRIKTLKCCCNSEVHLRGNLYVEYYNERDAARAWRRLKGRWYAGKQINCYFAVIPSWRSAICGMSKCPKGRACNYLHTFADFNNDYNIKSSPRRLNKSERELSSRRSNRSLFDESTRSEASVNQRNWRWSESPEVEKRSSPRSFSDWDKCTDERREDKKRSEHTKRSSRSSRSKSHHKSSRSRSTRSPRRSSSRKRKRRQSGRSDDERRDRSHSKKHCDTNKENGNDSQKDKRHEHACSKSEMVIKSIERETMNSDDDKLTRVENFDVHSIQMNEMKSNNDWDTTDSEEYKSS